MRPGVPWSVKGIEPEAREAAKQAARRAGMTLGAWLNQMILDTGPREGEDQSAPVADQTAAGAAARPALSPPLASIDLGPVTDAVRDLVQRSDESERRTMDMVHRLDQAIEQMAIRLDRSEQALAEGGGLTGSHMEPLERKIQHLTERLEAAESAPPDTPGEDPSAIQTLEKAVNAVVNHLETAEERAEKSFTEIREMLDGMSGRLAQAEQHRPGEDVQAALQTSLAELGERLDATERSMATIADGLEKTQADAVELALKAFSEKADSEHQQTTIEGIEKNLDEMKDRLDRVTTRSTDAIKTIEASLTTVAARLEEIGAPGRFVEPARLDALETKLDDLVQRTDQIDERTAAASETMDHALANLSTLSTELASTDARFEILDNLHDTMEQITQRVADLEAHPPPFLEKPATAETAAPDDFLEASVAEQAVPQAAALPESEADTAQASSMTWLDDTLGDDMPDTDAGGLNRDGQEAETGTSKLDDYLATARRAAQGAASDNGNALLGGSVLTGTPSRIAAYEEEKKRQRTKIITGAALVLLALVSALAMFRWSELSPQLDTPTIVVPPSPDLMSGDPMSGNLGSADPRDGNVLGPMEERVFDRDAGLSTDAPNLASEPTGQPTLEPVPGDPAPGEPAPGDAGAASLGAGGRVSLLPRPEEALPPVDAAPSTPVITAPVEAAKPSLASVAENGDAAAQYEMGLLYARGGTVAQDYEKAAAWFKKSADQGFASAQYRLATLYEKGRGMPEDAVTAREFYEQAAAQGNVKSMHNLAVIYAEGKGTDQDFSRAAHWFGKAAEFGLGDSQYNFAILNERGLGLPQDLAEAHKWFSIAAESGDAGAATRRDNVANQLDAETLVTAKLAARTWAPRQANPVANGDIASLRTWAEVNTAPSTPADIARAQALLTALGHDPGPADGLMGTRTREAIRAFQASAGLAETGEVTPELVDKLEAVTR